MSYVSERFELDPLACKVLRRMKPQFGYGGFGEITYYRSYSRMILDCVGNLIGQEHWADTVIRVINGLFSIRKDWYIKNRIYWDEAKWQNFASAMAHSMFRMEWLPPGRGLWSMGTDLVYERGSMALYNCAFTNIGKDWIEDLCYLMDTLMYGVGVGFEPIRCNLSLIGPEGDFEYQIPDTREGWVDSLRCLLGSFYNGTAFPIFDYSIIRPEGEIISTFGGLASGPGPLKDLHEKIAELCSDYINTDYDEVEFKTDLANLIGVCVVTGNVRRSAELALGKFDDDVFWTLKDSRVKPERQAWAWMSNNSVKLETDEHFEQIDRIAQANINGHDVGYLNMRNFPYGRIGKHDNVRLDKATGVNPCGEILLEDKELCNVGETLPTRCVDTNRWLKACEYITFYCSTVSLLPTHQPCTNRVVARNRRIGVSIIDVSGWTYQIGVSQVTAALRAGYETIRRVNKELADEAGVPESIRVTTIKPGGTVPKIAGRTAGAGHPTFHYTIRRIRVQANTTLERLLRDAGIPNEPDAYSKMTTVFEYPIIQGPARPATEVSIWEQAMNVVLLQREWADNMVSNTLYFKPKWILIGSNGIFREGKLYFSISEKDEIVVPANDTFTNYEGQFTILNERYKYTISSTQGNKLYKYNDNHEEDQIESVLAAIAPLTKSVSLLPHSEQGIFKQMPEEGITKEEYERRINSIKEIDWSKYVGTDGLDEKYCEGDKCVIV